MNTSNTLPSFINDIHDPLSASNSTKLILTLSTLLLISLVTRVISAFFFSSSNGTSQNGSSSPPAVPYWFPILGHIPSILLFPDTFVRNLRQKYRHGAFTLNFGGMRHNIIYSPDLVTSLLNQKQEEADSEHLAIQISRNVFGAPSTIWKDGQVEDLHALVRCYKFLQSEPSLSEIVEITAKNLKTNIKDLVTGNESLVDMMPWERPANIRVVSNSENMTIVEADLLSLIRDFVAHQATPSLFGTNFLENFPDFFTDLWNVDQAFLLLAAGLPRWVPIPSVTRAHISRKRALERLTKFHEALELDSKGEDTGADWSNLSDVSTLIKARTKIYRQYNYPYHTRAAIDFGLTWATNANSNALIFWLVVRIMADRALLEMIREEIAPFLSIVQPRKELAFAEPPRLEKVDIEGLCNSCPLLKSCYIECLRLDTATWSLKVAQKDFDLSARGSNKGQAYAIRKGDYCHAAHDLHNSDPTVFHDPDLFQADRHVKKEGVRSVAEQGSIRAFGGGASMCKGRAFAYKEIMLCTAAIIAMWDIAPADGQEWKLPSKKRATGVYGVKSDIRVRLRYRQDLPIA